MAKKENRNRIKNVVNRIKYYGDNDKNVWKNVIKRELYVYIKMAW